MPFGIPPLYQRRRPEDEEELPMFSSLMDQYNTGEDEIQTPVFDEYLDLIQNAPRREDFRPSLGRKILGGLAGAMTGFTSGAGAGKKMVEEITEGPYKRAQQDFQTELEPLEKGVGFERSFGETLRKRTADRQGFGAKLAKLEGDRAKALDQLDIAERRATNEEEKTRILAARANVEAEYKKHRAVIDRMNAGANQTRAGAAQTAANARMKNAGVYEKNQGGKPRHVPVNEQLKAEAVGAKEALDEILAKMPDIKATGRVPKLDDTGNLVFPEDMSEATKNMFTQIFNDTKTKKAKGRLGATY